MQRFIRTVPGFARLRGLVSTIDRWDLLLASIPLSFAGAGTVIRALDLPLEAGLVLAGVVGALALVDGLFLRPPNGLQGA